MTKTKQIRIHRVRTVQAKDIEAMVLGSDPWRTLGFAKSDVRKIAKSMRTKFVLGAFDKKRLVGFATLSFGFLGGAYLNLLVIDPEYRGAKLGTKLMQASEKIVFKKYKNFYLCASSFNKNAQRFYKRLGFTRIGKIDSFFLKEYGEFLYRKSTGPIRTKV